MALFIIAGAPLKDPENLCDRAQERHEYTMAQLGTKDGDVITMRDLLEVLGVSDSVICLPYVTKLSQPEAHKVLLSYMAYMVDIAISIVPLVDTPSFAKYLNPIKKRTQGHTREGPLAESNKFYTEQYADAFEPKTKFVWAALAALSSTKPDNIIAVHAGIALMDAGRADGRGEQVADMLKGKLRELIPTSEVDKWNK
jgi:hypothetical protein